MPARQRIGMAAGTALASAIGLAFLAGLSGQAPASKPASQAAPADKWEAAIAAFEKWDRKNTPPRDAVLFLGSSSIVGWSTAQAFPDLAVINRGFGGSEIADSTRYVDRIARPYRPRVVVLYAGDNDIAAGKSPETVLADFRAFVERVREATPAAPGGPTPIVFLSIKPSRSRWEHWPAMQRANALVAEECRRGAGLRYVDVATALLDKNGEPREELFLGDKLHLNEAGYAAWNEVVGPALRALVRG